MADLFLALGVIFNFISVILLQIQIRRLRREREIKFSVDDLKAANSLQEFCDSMDSSASFEGYVSRVYGDEAPHLLNGD